MVDGPDVVGRGQSDWLADPMGYQVPTYVADMLALLGQLHGQCPVPSQSSVAKAWQEFDEHGRMKPSPYYERVVDVMEELVRFTVLLRPHAEQLVDRYSERREAGLQSDATARLVEAAVA